jgi:hypothetical protein
LVVVVVIVVLVVVVLVALVVGDVTFFRWVFYRVVAQAANLVCPIKFRAPDTFVEVDLNGRFAHNVTYDDGVAANVDPRHHLRESGGGGGGGDSDDATNGYRGGGGGGGGGGGDDKTGLLVEDTSSGTFFRTTIRRSEVNPVWCVRMVAPRALAVCNRACVRACVRARVRRPRCAHTRSFFRCLFRSSLHAGVSARRFTLCLARRRPTDLAPRRPLRACLL